MAKSRAERASSEKLILSLAEPNSIIKVTSGESPIEMGEGLDPGLKLLIVQALEAKKITFTIETLVPEPEPVTVDPVDLSEQLVPETLLETMLAEFGIFVEEDPKSGLVRHFTDPVTDIGYTFDLVTSHWFSSQSFREVGVVSLRNKLYESRPGTENTKPKSFVPKFGLIDLPPAPKR